MKNHSYQIGDHVRVLIQDTEYAPEVGSEGVVVASVNNDKRLVEVRFEGRNDPFGSFPLFPYEVELVTA